jgi:DNA polymerase delta subunit 3
MTDALMTRLATATTEEGKTVTYKWVAREFDVSVNHAKRLLFEHARNNDSVLVATHVVSGWTSTAGDDGAGVTRTQVVRLVEGAEALAAAKAALDGVTGEHVYSVRPVDAKDAAVGGDAAKSLPPACVAQTDAMFDASPSTPNALRDNRHSAVRCASAKRDDGPARRVSAKPKTSSPAEAKRPAPAAAKAKAAPSKAEPAAAASSKPSGAFAGFKPVDKKANGANPKEAPPKPAGRPAAKGAGAMAAMFAKAPPKKATAPAAPEPAPVPVEEDSEEEEEEEIMEAPRHRRGGGRRVLGLDEDEDEDDETEAEETKASGAVSEKPPSKAAEKSSAKKKSPAKKRKSVETARDETVTETVASSPAPSKEKRPKKEKEKAPTPPPKKPLFATTAPSVTAKRGKRVKKVITVMDDETGEEFTKTVWVDGDTGEEIKEEDVEMASNAALEEKTNAKKSAAPRSPAKPKPAEKKKIDAPAKVSKGIASFFGKK